MRRAALICKSAPPDKWISLPFEGVTLSINTRAIPTVILRQGLPFEVDPVKIWTLNRPISRIPRAALDWMLEVPFWPSDSTLFALTPNEVLRDPESHPAHAKKIEEARLNFPIDVIWYRKRWLILDGLHRLAKARAMNHADLAVRKHKLSELEQRASCTSLETGGQHEPAY